MKMNQLLRYDVPPEVIALWRDRESDTLLPLQEMAVKRHDLFGPGNLLIQAPTSSGKTFIGEMAVIRTALQRKKVVYLVPLKALAEEKYLDFCEKYTEYGLKVIVSTRDHRDFDRDFDDGSFSIAVVVYEKLSQLIVRRPERLAEIDLVIADELEILSDPERGAMAEILLTRLLQGNCRLIGLSAVIGEAEKLAEWMQAQMLYYDRRPVELRFGVLHEGAFKYRTYNELGEGEEPLAEAGGDSPWEILTHNVCALTEAGEACLVFVKAKHESRHGAELLAGRVSLPAANHAIEALRDLEATRSRDSLLRTLENGVAFHNADLSPLERRIVEQAFREGEARLMVSTSTLAVGLNMPARNVFLSADRWRYDDRLGMPWKTPISRSEYENMSGRAGRYGAGHEFGRSMLIATSPFDLDTFWRRYIEGEREPIEPRLARDPLENHVLRLVASRFCRSDDELLTFLESTLSGKWVWAECFTIEETAFRVRAAVNRCLDAGVITRGLDDRLEATPLGCAVAAKGISIATARDLEHWIGESETRTWSPLDLLFAAATTADGRTLQVMLTAREYERANYPAQLKERTRHEELSADVPINRLRNCNLQPFFEDVRAVKVALFLDEWIAQTSVHDLEERYNTMAGQILSAADQLSWIIDATAAIATALGAQRPFVECLEKLAERVSRGLEAEALPLARLKAPGLTRNLLIDLAGQGLHRAESLHKTTKTALRRLVSATTATVIKAWAAEQIEGQPHAKQDGDSTQESAPSLSPVLIVDDNTPSEILIDGNPVALQEKQYRLISILAANPGVCVPYETIYTAVWGEDVVENNQMHFQKRKLIKRITTAVPHREDLIKTVPKRGFTLTLDPSDVLHKAAQVSTAA